MRILGIDPGTLRLGYGVIECSGAGASTVRYVECGVISASARKARAARGSRRSAAGCATLLAEMRPDAVAMEEAFYGVNVQSTLALGEARGVALFVAAEQGLTVTGYPPATVKQAVVGHGRATKQQVGYLVRALLALRRTPEPDAADALAIAICHARRQGARAAREEPRVIAYLQRERCATSDGDVDGHRRRRRRLSGASSAPRRRRGCRPAARSQLFVHTHFVKDEPLRLYGFADTAERRLFQTLDQRAGGRTARRARDPRGSRGRASWCAPSPTADVNRLTQIKGVGRKTAERLALELREKILMLPSAAGRPAAPAAAAGEPRPRRPAGRGLRRAGAARLQAGEIEPLLDDDGSRRGRSPNWCARRWRRCGRR